MIFIVRDQKSKYNNLFLQKCLNLTNNDDRLQNDYQVVRGNNLRRYFLKMLKIFYPVKSQLMESGGRITNVPTCSCLFLCTKWNLQVITTKMEMSLH